MTNSINNKKIKLRTATLSLIIGILLLLVKFSAYLITDSAAIFSDAAESVINVVAAAVALYSVMLSSKPADKDAQRWLWLAKCRRLLWPGCSSTWTWLSRSGSTPAFSRWRRRFPWFRSYTTGRSHPSHPKRA